MPPPEEKSKKPTLGEIKELPRWAQVAFAARCARRVQPVFQACWPSAPQKHVHAISRAIRVAEASAALGTASAAARAAVHDAANAANAANDAANDAYIAAAHDATRDAANAAYSAAHAAYTAAYTANAIGATATAAATAAANAAAYAAEIVRTASPIRRDFELLKTLTMEREWTDDTPVPPDAFGPMWPDGEPEGWPSKENATDMKPSRKGTWQYVWKKAYSERRSPAQIVVVWDPELVDTDGYADLVTALGDLVRTHGGEGIERIHSRGFGVPVGEGVVL